VVDPAATVAGGGEQASPAPVTDQVLAGDVERPTPMPAATLPRTGAGIGDQVTLAGALLAAGIALLRVFRRRRPSTQAS
jgi:LPXTG-motif cell wall-anchored protein